MKELICIVCPKGCHLKVDEENGWAVSGNSCPKGAEYGRTELQNRAYDYAKKLLTWRKTNKAVGRGTMKHFSIAHGCYVYERKHEDQSVVVIMNGTGQAQELDLTPYKEILPKAEAKDILSGKTIQLGEKLTLQPRQSLLLEF